MAKDDVVQYNIRLNLNNPRDLSAHYSAEQIAAMTNEEKVEALSKIWRNYCISDSYHKQRIQRPCMGKR